MSEDQIGELSFIGKQLERIADALENLASQREFQIKAMDRMVEAELKYESAGDSKPAPQKKGKYTWYPLADDQYGKPLRKCDNPGCPLWLRYSEEKKSYEHWKYDPNTGKGAFVQERCDYYGV